MVPIRGCRMGMGVVVGIGAITRITRSALAFQVPVGGIGELQFIRAVARAAVGGAGAVPRVRVHQAVQRVVGEALFLVRRVVRPPGHIPNAVHAVLFLGHASLNTVMMYTEPRLEDLAERMVG